MAEVVKGIENPLPTTSPTYEGPNGGLVVSIEWADSLMDVLERIQQQLAMINEGENLELGERHYG